MLCSGDENKMVVIIKYEYGEWGYRQRVAGPRGHQTPTYVEAFRSVTVVSTAEDGEVTKYYGGEETKNTGYRTIAAMNRAAVDGKHKVKR